MSGESSIEELLKQHRELIEAETARKATEQAVLDEKRKIALAESRRAANIEELLSRVGHLVEAVTQQNGLITRLLSQQPISAAIAELTDEVRDGMEHIEDSMRLLLEVNRALLVSVPAKRVENKAQLAEAIKKATNGQSIQRQIERIHRRLNRLKEQKASLGALAPASLFIEIEDAENEIETLQGKLHQGDGE